MDKFVAIRLLHTWWLKSATPTATTSNPGLSCTGHTLFAVIDDVRVVIGYTSKNSFEIYLSSGDIGGGLIMARRLARSAAVHGIVLNS